MSKDNSRTTPPTGREALRQRQQAAATADRRVSIAIRSAWIAGLAVAALLIGVTTWSIVGARSGNTAGSVVAADGLVTPTSASDSGAIVIGKPEAKVTVTVFLDFMCPYCGQFERANGSALAAAVDNGTAKLEVHPMAFLDDLSAGTKYSTRAANAFAAVANHDPATALAFSQLLFAQQPAENSAGLTDATIGDLASKAGAPADVVASFSRQAYQPWVAKITKQAFDSGITGTPTVKINGQTFTGDLYTAGPLAEAIKAAANG
ncbi:MAG TPA: thioredoxin domain-containing protein [Propionicimonas sp.]